MTTTLLPEPNLGSPLVCVLGFPRYATRVERRYPTPFRKDGGTRRRRRVGVDKDRDFARPPETTSPDAPSCSTNLATHQHTPPRSCNHHRHLTKDHVARPERPRRRGTDKRQQYNSTREGSTSTADGGS